MTVELVRFRREHLPRIVSWFDDPETRRWLGGREWPARSARMLEQPVGEVFRGAVVLATFGFIARRDDRVVGYIGGDVYDREPVLDAVPGVLVPVRRTAGLSLVVAPHARRQGIAVNMLHLLHDHPDLASVQDWMAGVEPNNTASAATFRAAGYRPSSAGVDAEGVLMFVRGSSG